jgi:hypothetical protein
MIEFGLILMGVALLGILFVVFFGAPYVPTLRRDQQDILAIRPLGKHDVFVDLGSGDGTILRGVAAHCGRAVGVELSPWLVLISKWLCRSTSNIQIVLGSIWAYTLPAETTVVYTFFNGTYIPRIEKILQDHVDKHQRPVDMITFGFMIDGRTPQKNVRAMYLYRFEPLQNKR